MKVNMTIADGRDGFFQYDENAFLLVSGCHEVHFCHSGDDETVVVPVIPHDDSADDLFCPLSFRRHHGHRGATGHVLVPASLLQSSADIVAYGAGLDNTFCRFVFTVEPRPKPGKKEERKGGKRSCDF